MEVRPAKKEDWPQLIELCEGHSFRVPELENLLDVMVAEDNGKIVAWVYTEKFVEAVFVPNTKSSNITKVKSLKLLTQKSAEITKARGIKQIHSFVKDEHFADLLVKRFHYGIITGIPLFLNLDDNG